MAQITAQIPDELVEALDAVSKRLNRSRASVIRQAIERYLEDFDDVAVARDRLQDASDTVLDWVGVRSELLGADQSELR